jgi:hypothetical protein
MIDCNLDDYPWLAANRIPVGFMVATLTRVSRKGKWVLRGSGEPVAERGLTVDWSGFWDWKSGPANAHYLQGPVGMGEPHI